MPSSEPGCRSFAKGQASGRYQIKAVSDSQLMKDRSRVMNWGWINRIWAMFSREVNCQKQLLFAVPFWLWTIWRASNFLCKLVLELWKSLYTSKVKYSMGLKTQIARPHQSHYYYLTKHLVMGDKKIMVSRNCINLHNELLHIEGTSWRWVVGFRGWSSWARKGGWNTWPTNHNTIIFTTK